MTRRLFFSAACGFCLGAAPRIAVIAHRGEHLHHPENTVAAIEGALAAGADYVELDVRTARDGTLVLHHDAQRRGVPIAASAPEGLTAFDDALAALRRRGALYLDWKDAAPEALHDALRRHGMAARTVVYGSPERLARLQALLPEVRVMPEAVSAGHLDQVLATLHPPVVAFDRRDFTPPLIARARAAGAGIFVDRLGEEDTEAHWAEAIRLGATGIQTDRPADLVRFLGR